LRTAKEFSIDRLTLATDNLKTIPPLLVEWGLNGVSHGGAILIDDRTIASCDFGGLIRALTRLWDE